MKYSVLLKLELFLIILKVTYYVPGVSKDPQSLHFSQLQLSENSYKNERVKFAACYDN